MVRRGTADVGGAETVGCVRVLLIEDDEAYSALVRTLLEGSEARVSRTGFALTSVSRLKEGLTRLSERPVDVVLLDLGLPDSTGLQTLETVRQQAHDLAIVVLTGAADERMALEALHRGAQDYLIKTATDGSVLGRAVRYAIERQKLLGAIEKLSLLDHDTGLYNRRGFFTLAERQVALCRRQRRPLTLLLADLDGLKHINDRYGHQEGDRVIALIGAYLKAVSRKADVVARLGGDEFAVLLGDGDETSASALQARLQHRLRRYNRQGSLPYRITLSMGVACRSVEGDRPLERVMADADAEMYRHKQRARSRQRS